jgi:hypothetical protein
MVNTDVSKYAVVQRTDYDRETGLLTVQVLFVHGGDPNIQSANWTVAGSGGIVPLMIELADQVTADKATVAADKATVAADKGIVAADKATVASDKDDAAASAAAAAASAILAATFEPENYYLTTEVDANITAAINALIDVAPGTLDTLNELAAALGDDANFAATVTTALAGKAPTSRSIGVAGLATGGGDLSADRTITVSVASQAEAEAGTATDKAMTPERTAQAIEARAGLKLITTLDGATGTPTTLSATDLGDYGDLYVVIKGISTSADELTLRVAFSTNNGSSYGTAINVSWEVLAAASAYHAVMLVDGMKTGRLLLVATEETTSGTGQQTPSTQFAEGIGYAFHAAAVNAIRFSLSGAGNFDAGTIEIWGRP